MPRGDPSVELSPVKYKAWLEENPKIVDQGPIKLDPLTEFSDPNAVKFDSHLVVSKELPKQYADKTMILSE
jgi:hypothetical protein